MSVKKKKSFTFVVHSDKKVVKTITVRERIVSFNGIELTCEGNELYTLLEELTEHQYGFTDGVLFFPKGWKEKLEEANLVWQSARGGWFATDILHKEFPKISKTLWESGR